MAHEIDIVIPHASLPEALLVSYAYIGGVHVRSGDSEARVTADAAQHARARALEMLAIAEKIDKFLAEEADRKLRDEASALREKVDGRALYGGHPDPGLAFWEKVARAAREVYSVK